MKKKLEIVKAWIKKAENDLLTAKHCMNIKPNPPTDIICFHAQQCAEKYIKAFLVYHEIEFAKTHDLGYLINLASKVNPDFSQLTEIAERLTDYAVDVRYPFFLEEPTLEDALEAIKMAEKIKDFVLRNLKVLD